MGEKLTADERRMLRGRVCWGRGEAIKSKDGTQQFWMNEPVCIGKRIHSGMFVNVSDVAPPVTRGGVPIAVVSLLRDWMRQEVDRYRRMREAAAKEAERLRVEGVRIRRLKKDAERREAAERLRREDAARAAEAKRRNKEIFMLHESAAAIVHLFDQARRNAMIDEAVRRVLVRPCKRRPLQTCRMLDSRARTAEAFLAGAENVAEYFPETYYRPWGGLPPARLSDLRNKTPAEYAFHEMSGGKCHLPKRIRAEFRRLGRERAA